MSQWSRYSIPDREWEEASRSRDTPSLPRDILNRRKLYNNATRKYIDAVGDDSLRGISVEERRINVSQPDGHIAIRTYVPDPVYANESFPLLLNFHGGGYCLGNLDTDELKCRSFCSEGRVVVVNVDYRLAPEFPWPTGLEDSYTTFKWAMEHTEELKVDISKGCIVCGLSNGAIFAMALTQRARSNPRYNRVISGQILQFPPTWNSGNGEHEGDLRDQVLSFEHTKDDLLLGLENIRMFAEAYKPGPSTETECSPLVVESTRGLPAAYIQIAGRDPYRDEGLLYAQRLEAEDVPVNVKVYPGVPHDFANILPHLQVSRRWRDDCNKGVKWLIHTAQLAKDRVQCKL